MTNSKYNSHTEPLFKELKLLKISDIFKIQCMKFWEREREIKFIGLFGDRWHRGPYSPYKPFNYNLYIGIIIFPHIDNPQSTGYD